MPTKAGFICTQGQNLRVKDGTSETTRYNLGGARGARERGPPVLSILPRCHLRQMLNERLAGCRRDECAFSPLCRSPWGGGGWGLEMGIQRKLPWLGSPSKFIHNHLPIHASGF